MNWSLIVASSENGVIGQDGALPWRLSADMKFFKATTTGKTILMGRKTWDSIGRPLPNRKNVILTRQRDWHAEGTEVVHDWQEAVSRFGDESVVVIGGAEIYHQVMHQGLVSELFVTEVKCSVTGNAYFETPSNEAWSKERLAEVTADEKNDYDHVTYRYFKTEGRAPLIT